MSTSPVTKFCDKYRQFFGDPDQNFDSVPELIDMLEKMTSKEVDRAYRELEAKGILIGSANFPKPKEEELSSKLTTALARLNLLAGKRFGGNVSKPRKKHHSHIEH